MRTFTRTLVFGAAALLIGCQDTTPEEQGGSWTVEPEVAAPPEPIALGWCSPAPVAYDASQVPALPEGVALEGFCDVPALAESEDTPTHTLSMDTDARVLTVTEGDASLGQFSRETFTFDDQGRVVFVTRSGTSGFYGAGEGSSSYELDVRGEVVHKIASEFDLSTAIVKHQEWDGDRLLWRTERTGEDGPLLRRWSWTWEDGVLVRGELVQDPDGPARRVFSSRWTYDDDGAPSSVERWIEDELIEREAWTLRDDGTLASRTRRARSAESLVKERGGELADWTIPTGLDDHQVERAPIGGVTPWLAATSHTHPSEDAGCARLPRGAHGYPASEGEYDLGVEVGARPSGIGFAYGSDTYMWSYGDDSWFGHDGVASGWLGAVYDPIAEVIESTVEYDMRGTMTRELATLTTESAEFTVDRQRSLDESGRVLEDALEVTAGVMSYARALEFERDAHGAVVARTLLDADGEPSTTQTWTRDDRGRALRHDVGEVDFIGPPAWARAFSGLRTPAAEPNTAWVWRYDGDLLVARGLDGADTLQRLSYDDEGRLIERVGEYDNREGSDLSVTYDALDRVVERCQGSGGWMTSICVETSYDEAGRVARRTRAAIYDGVEREPELVAYHRHVCE